MKYLKTFFEAVINPYNFDEVLQELENSEYNSIDELNITFISYGVMFVDVAYFKSKLQTKKELELVPDKLKMYGGIKFAAHNIYTNMMYVCVEEDEFLDSLNNPNKKKNMIALLNEILRHESIHKQQGEKRDVVIRNLENSPVSPEKYFGSTDEMMAYAQSFIDQCHQKGLNNDDIIDIIRKNNTKSSWIQDIYSKLPEKIKKRFFKYVYQYLTK